MIKLTWLQHRITNRRDCAHANECARRNQGVYVKGVSLLAVAGVFISCLHAGMAASEQNAAPGHLHTPAMPPHDDSCRLSDEETFENIQIESADIRLHEALFEQVLHASVIQRLDHPLTDSIRAYCYRHVLVVIRQDLRTPRPTGWVQLNFVVKDVIAVQQELESAARTAFAALQVEEREKIVRFRLKLGVTRSDRKVDRFEVYGPEGFLIGFDQQH